jgi:hypothetical protein
MKKRFLLTLIIGLTISLISSGCVVKDTIDQPSIKDTTLLRKGTPRIKVIAEFGQPIKSQNHKDGSITDIYSFVQGYYSEDEKVGIALFQGVIFIVNPTLSLVSEKISSLQTEDILEDKITISVKYNKLRLVDKVKHIL